MSARCVAAVCVVCQPLSAAIGQPTREWVAAYPDKVTRYETIGRDIEENLYVVGGVYQPGTPSVVTRYLPLVAKYDPAGTELWSTTNLYDQAAWSNTINASVISGDGRLIVGGSSYPDATDLFDEFVAVHDADGVVLWSDYFRGPKADWVIDIVEDSAGDYIVASMRESYQRTSLRKYDRSGNLLWSLLYAPGGSLVNTSEVRLGPDDSIYLFSTILDLPAMYEVVRFDRDGRQQWATSFSDLDGRPLAQGSSAAAVHDDGSVVAAFALDAYPPERTDTLIVGLNGRGRMEWRDTYDGASDRDVPHEVVLGQGGAAHLLLSSRFPGDTPDMLILTYDRSGRRLWEARWGGAFWDHPGDIEVDQFGNVYAVGNSHSTRDNYDVLLAKFDSKGRKIWEQRYDGPEQDWDTGYMLTRDAEGGIYIAGSSARGGPGSINAVATVIKYRERFCDADCNRDGLADFLDFLCFQSHFAAGAPEADCDGDGKLNLFDFLCFQAAFASGCP